MSGSVIAPMIGMAGGAGCYVAAVAWRLRRRAEVYEDVFGGVAIAALIGGVAGYNLALWLGMLTT